MSVFLEQYVTLCSFNSWSTYPGTVCGLATICSWKENGVLSQMW